MPSLNEHRAALAATLIDEEVLWMLRRVPPRESQNPFHRALLREAERRGFRAR